MQNIADGQEYTLRVQPTEGDGQQLSESEDDCLHPTHNGTPRHCPPDVFTRIEQCLGDTSGGKQSHRASLTEIDQVSQM